MKNLKSLYAFAFVFVALLFAPAPLGFASDIVTMVPENYLQIVFNKPVTIVGDTANAFCLNSSKGKIPVMARLNFIGSVADGEKGSYSKFWLEPLEPLEEGVEYQLTINNTIRAIDGSVMVQPFITNIKVVGSTVEPWPPTDTEGNGYSRRSPAPIGKTVRAEWSDRKGSYTADIALKEIVRGYEAWHLIKETNRFNDPPEEGYEYILAKINFKYLIGPGIDIQYNAYKNSFTAVLSIGKDYKRVSAVLPFPELNVYLYPGASAEGWAVFQVEKTDVKPLLTFGRDNNGEGGVWFKLYERNRNY